MAWSDAARAAAAEARRLHAKKDSSAYYGYGLTRGEMAHWLHVARKARIGYPYAKVASKNAWVRETAIEKGVAHSVKLQKRLDRVAGQTFMRQHAKSDPYRRK